MKPPFPKGVKLAANQSTAPITKGETLGRGYFMAKAPELEGIRCQIQHPSKPGEKPEVRTGLFGAGVLLLDGAPSFVVQMKHEDGTSLMAVLSPQEFCDFGGIYASLPAMAELAMRTPRGEG